MPPRPVRSEDLPQVGLLLDEVFRKSRGVFDQSQLTDFPLVFAPENLHNNRLIEIDSEIVSHAALWPRRLVINNTAWQVALVVSVATHPNYRLRGLAAELMRCLQDYLPSLSVDFAILWTSVPDFYAKLGWECVTPRGLLVEIPPSWVGTSPGSDADTEGLSVRAYDSQSDLVRVNVLYKENSVRLERELHQARALFSLPKVRLWVAERAGSIVAYLVHGQAINKQGITEYGGELGGIIRLLKHTRENVPALNTLRLLVYHSRRDLWDWVNSQRFATSPLPSSKGANHEMIYCVGSRPAPEYLRRDLFVWGLDHA